MARFPGGKQVPENPKAMVDLLFQCDQCGKAYPSEWMDMAQPSNCPSCGQEWDGENDEGSSEPAPVCGSKADPQDACCGEWD